MKRWQAVVFDLDDTLFPEREYVFSGFGAVADWAEGELGIAAADGFAELRALFDAGVRGDTFNRWLARHGVAEGMAPRLVEVYRGHAPRLRPFDGVPELLERLARRVPLGVVTDGYAAVQRAKFAALGLGEHFTSVVFSDDLGRECWKPSPAPFLRVLEGLGVPGDAAVYVGDNCTKDFIGARGAGLDTVWARHSAGDYAARPPASAAHAADTVVESVAELDALLGERTGGGMRGTSHGKEAMTDPRRTR